MSNAMGDADGATVIKIHDSVKQQLGSASRRSTCVGLKLRSAACPRLTVKSMFPGV